MVEENKKERYIHVIKEIGESGMKVVHAATSLAKARGWLKKHMFTLKPGRYLVVKIFNAYDRKSEQVERAVLAEVNIDDDDGDYPELVEEGTEVPL